MSGTMTNISTENVKEIELTEKESMRKITEENMLHMETLIGKDEYNDVEKIREKSDIEDTEHDNNSIQNGISNIKSDTSENEEESSDEEKEAYFTNDKIDNEDKETNAEESYMEMNNKSTKCKEVHMLYEDSSMSKDDDVNSGYDSMKPKKKKTKIQLKAKIHSYFHKSYDKVSNVIMRTSKSFIKSGHTSDYRSDKMKSKQSGSMLFTSKSDELIMDQNNNILLEDELNMLKDYFDDKINVEKSNIEILNQFKLNLENNIPEKLLNTLTDLLIERKLLIKSVNHFKYENETIKSCLEKYKNSYFILKTENEQLNENAKTLKSYIDNIQKYNENDINDVADKMTTTNDISVEPKEEN